MSLIKTVDPEKAEGKAGEIYDILEALSHGTNMIGSSILMKAFKMDQAC